MKNQKDQKEENKYQETTTRKENPKPITQKK